MTFRHAWRPRSGRVRPRIPTGRLPGSARSPENTHGPGESREALSVCGLRFRRTDPGDVHEGWGDWFASFCSHQDSRPGAFQQWPEISKSERRTSALTMESITGYTVVEADKPRRREKLSETPVQSCRYPVYRSGVDVGHILHPVNLAVLELAVLAALAVWGWQRGDGWHCYFAVGLPSPAATCGAHSRWPGRSQPLGSVSHCRARVCQARTSLAMFAALRRGLCKPFGQTG